MDLAFVIGVALMCWSYGFWDLRYEGPRGLHQWRQSDCLSFTQNYYEEDLPFLEPAMHFAGQDVSGKTISEFPLIYYGIAKIWKIFGKNEGVYRLCVLMYFLLALYALYRTIGDRLKDRFLGLWVVLLLFTSPTLVYYSFNFLPNIPALSSVFIAWSLLYQFWKRSRIHWLILSFLFFTLGALLKTSAALSLIALFFVAIMDPWINPGQEKSSNKSRYIIIGSLASFAAIGAWYLYARSYNAIHQGNLFMYLWGSIWELSGDEISSTIAAVKEHFRWSYFRPLTYALLLLFYLVVIRYFKKFDRSTLSLLALTSVGTVAFFALFFNAFKDHDYYTIDLFILIPILCLAFFVFAHKKWPLLMNSWLLRIALLVLIVHNADFARRRMEWRYSGWMDKNYSQYTVKFDEVKKGLRQIGISRTDLVISLPDRSLNNSLYAMDQKGWTDFEDLLNDSSAIRNKISKGAEYLIITDSLSGYPHIDPFTKEPIGKFNDILVYDLRNY